MPIPEHGNFGKEHDDHAVDYGLLYFSKLYNPPIINQQGFNRQVQSTWVVPAHFFFWSHACFLEPWPTKHTMHQWPLIKRFELDGCWRFLFLDICGFVWIWLAYLQYSAISVRITMTNEQLLGCFLHNFRQSHTHICIVSHYIPFLHPIISYDYDSMIISHFVQSSNPCVCEMVAATIQAERAIGAMLRRLQHLQRTHSTAPWQQGLPFETVILGRASQLESEQ